ELRRLHEPAVRTEATEGAPPGALAVAAVAPGRPPATGPLGVDGVLAAAAGAIDGLDRELILLTRVDGRRLAELADSSGVAYDALRKRRQRAEARLRR